MSWTIERHDRVALVTMNTNKVNAQNRAFFEDFHEAFDQLEREHGNSPVVLTGSGSSFSAGLDLEEHIPLFAGRQDAVASWFDAYRAMQMRLFTYPRPTIAALNGHAFAGGLIIAALCDHRIAVDDDSVQFGMTEAMIGIPVPAAFVRMLAYAWGEPAAARACLRGEVFHSFQAFALGLVHELVPREELLLHATTAARRTQEDCMEQYAFTKRASQAPALRDIEALAGVLDTDLPRSITSADARRAHQRFWEELKGPRRPVMSES